MHEAKDILFQMDICWQLFEYHTSDLSEEDALWCKTVDGLQIRSANGKWQTDWPETESYTIGPASIAWTLWHILFWWKSTLSASFGANGKGAILSKEEVQWPDSVEKAVQEIHKCHEEWCQKIEAMTTAELESTERCRWPFEGATFYDLALWLNAELMKNAAEIGQGRFLYAVEEENHA